MDWAMRAEIQFRGIVALAVVVAAAAPGAAAADAIAEWWSSHWHF